MEEFVFGTILLHVRHGKFKGGLKLYVADFENFVFAVKFQSTNAVTEKFSMLLATRNNLADAEHVNFLTFLSTVTEIFLPTVEGMFDFDSFSGGTRKFPWQITDIFA
jgi:hypothetical protein